MSQPELSLHISKVTIIQFCHPSRQTTHARSCVWSLHPPKLWTSGPHIIRTLADNQHENAAVSFIDLRSYVPEISGVRSSKLPPFLRGGDKSYTS